MRLDNFVILGVPVPDTAYAVTAIILLPINAAVNPFLYSDIVDIVWKMMLPVRQWSSTNCCGHIRGAESDHASDSGRSLLLLFSLLFLIAVHVAKF